MFIIHVGTNGPIIADHSNCCSPDTESQIAPRLYIFSQNTNLNTFLYTSTITQAEETTPSAAKKKSKCAL